MTDINENNFLDFLNQKEIVVLDFHNLETCIPCKELHPIFYEFSKNHLDIGCGFVNVKENRKFSISQKVMGVPTVIIYKNGKEIERFMGSNCIADVERTINNCK